jgi:hypothetical protein
MALAITSPAVLRRYCQQDTRPWLRRSIRFTRSSLSLQSPSLNSMRYGKTFTLHAIGQ